MMFPNSNFLKRSVVWSLFLCLSVSGYAQQFEWAQGFGGLGLDAGRAVTTDDDGNVFLIGSFSGTANIGGTWFSGNGVQEAFVAKFNSAGTLLWVNLISGPEEDLGRGAVTDVNGNVFVVGHYTDTVTFYQGQAPFGAAGSEGGQDMFIAKYDSNGNLLWFRTCGGTGEDTATDIDLYQPTGKVYVSGGFENRGKFGSTSVLSSGLSDAFLMSMDGDGNVDWVRHGGGNEHDVAAAVAVDKTNESIYIVGDFYDEVNFDGTALQTAGASDMFLAKYDASGNQIWIRANGGTNVDVATDVGVDHSHRVYVSGYYQLTTVFQNFSATSEGYNDVFLSQFDADGNCNWLTSAGGDALDNCLGLDVMSDGTTYMTGMFDEEMFAGNETITGDGYDIFILCYESSGNLRYGRSAGAGQSDFGMATCLGPDEVLYISGYYFYFSDFDGHTIGAADNGDGFLAKLTNIVSVDDDQASRANDCIRFQSNGVAHINCMQTGTWLVLNTIGQEIASGPFTNGQVDLSLFDGAMYFLQINDGKSILTLPFIKP